MRACWLVFLLAVLLLLPSGGCGSVPKPPSLSALEPARIAKQPDGQPPALAVAAREADSASSAEPADERLIVRHQDDSSGMWSLPGWDSIKDSTAIKGVKKLVGRDLNESRARELFQQAEELFRQAEYSEAAGLYKKASRHWPDSALEEDALFMLGECQFFSDQYPKASDTYAELLKKYENSRHLDKAVHRQFTIAEYWQKLHQSNPKFVISPNLTDKTRPRFDTAGNALAAYESVRLNDPTGPQAAASIMKTAEQHFVQGRFEDADYYYGLLRSEYPKSEFLVQAYVLGLRSKLRKYGGPQYDATPLLEAQQLVEQMLTQFPTELGEERERVIQAGRAIEAQLAERDWAMGEYYHKNKYYRAAGIYYRDILDKYPGTQFAEMAQARLHEIGDKPPEPPDRFTWFSKIFGSSKRL